MKRCDRKIVCVMVMKLALHTNDDAFRHEFECTTNLKGRRIMHNQACNVF